MEIKDMIPMIFERFSAYQTLWNLYITVVLGVIGFVAAVKTLMSSNTLRIIVTIGFLAFAMVNLRALNKVHQQRTILVDLALKKADKENDKASQELIQKLITTGRPDGKYAVWTFHITIDVIVVALIWLVPSAKSVRDFRST